MALERMTVNLTPKASRSLAELTELLELSKTDVVNRALQVYAFVEREQAQGSQFILARDGGSQVLKLL